MSVEEKSWYTRRDCEVWDDYLSSAPAHVQKPRRQVDNRNSVEPRITPEEAVKLCDRNFGIRADGEIFAMPGINGTDYTMRISNSDGGKPEDENVESNRDEDDNDANCSRENKGGDEFEDEDEALHARIEAFKDLSEAIRQFANALMLSSEPAIGSFGPEALSVLRTTSSRMELWSREENQDSLPDL